MKKVACAILILTIAIFLINPLSSEAMRADYQRAQGACLDGRGYTVK